MHPRAVTAAQAARELGITPRHVRRLARSCGAVVAERPLRVDVEAIQRARTGNDVAERLADAALAVMQRDCGAGKTAPEYLRIDLQKAAGLLLFAFDRTYTALTGRARADPLPEAIRTVQRMAGLP